MADFACARNGVSLTPPVRIQIRAIDIVHKNFIETYVSDHAIPFAERVSEKALKHATEIVTGEAFVTAHLKHFQK